ncbi:unnamed protein product [Prorocentrum cordatum]|uniref:Uncharacterized protein n=1 Tax=Prorocentrum cordatum TaxID=2364126 RepID=A0ABN9VP17_9DINO|nr:unnamed protein product [Polarella glacialis]
MTKLGYPDLFPPRRPLSPSHLSCSGALGGGVRRGGAGGRAPPRTSPVRGPRPCLFAAYFTPRGVGGRGPGSAGETEGGRRGLHPSLSGSGSGMMATVGMFFHDGTVGAAWDDWACCAGSPLRALRSELGVRGPVGWDPAGLAADGGTESFASWRQTELGHGRVFVLLTVSYIASYITCRQDPAYFWDPIGLMADGGAEDLARRRLAELQLGRVRHPSPPACRKITGNPNDLDAISKVLTSSGVGNKQKNLKDDIANCLLVTLAFTGMPFHGGYIGSAWAEWTLCTGSPPRVQCELSVQGPTYFWGPIGLAAGGSAEDLARRRQAELQLGRVSMLTTTGHNRLETAGTLSVCFSPPDSLKVADIPCGLEATSPASAASCAQIVAFGAFCDLSRTHPADATAATDDVGFQEATPSDSDEVQKKNSAPEIANGCLATMAIIELAL